jgi:hypothetical protein
MPPNGTRRAVVPSSGEPRIPVTSYLLHELRDVVEKFSSMQDEQTEKVRLDRRDVTDFLNLADRIRAEADEFLKGHIWFET